MSKRVYVSVSGGVVDEVIGSASDQWDVDGHRLGQHRSRPSQRMKSVRRGRPSVHPEELP